MRTSDRITRWSWPMAWCSRVVELKAHFQTPAECKSQRLFTVENGNLTMVYPPTCSGNTVVASLTCKTEGDNSPESFFYWNIRNMEQTIAKLSSQSKLWVRVLMGRLGRRWVVWRTQNKTTVWDPPWEDFSQSAVIRNERNMWKRVWMSLFPHVSIVWRGKEKQKTGEVKLAVK